MQAERLGAKSRFVHFVKGHVSEEFFPGPRQRTLSVPSPVGINRSCPRSRLQRPIPKRPLTPGPAARSLGSRRSTRIRLSPAIWAPCSASKVSPGCLGTSFDLYIDRAPSRGGFRV